MVELEVQKLARKHDVIYDALDQLQTQYGIERKFHSEYPNLVLLKYNQIKSSMSNPIVQECRGLILDMTNNWDVVCFPFKKFFNYGESNAAKVNWGSAKCYEKYDGSLCSLYFYDKKWHVATSGSPDASGKVGDYNITFKDLFWETWKELYYILPNNAEFTYIFELCTPYNQNVVKHKTKSLPFIGYRNNISFEEWFPDYSFRVFYDWEPAVFIHLSDECFLESVIKNNNSRSPMEHEGYVICDENFNRVKLKSEQYVALHHLKGNGTPNQKRVLELILAGEVDEFISYFPEFASLVNKLIDALDCLITDINNAYQNIVFTVINNLKTVKNITQKEFAAEAIKYSFRAVLFEMRKLQSSEADYGILKTLKEFGAEKVLNMLGEYIETEL